MKPTPRWIVAPLAMLLPALAAAQSNTVPGLDIRLSNMRAIESLGRSGTFPDGMNGVAIETTVCNEGTVEVDWLEAMNPAHPKIAFLIASVRNGRIEQISDRSFVKHGFFAVNGSGCHTTCFPPTTLGVRLGVGCSDTYATTNNGDNYYLGSPDEVDPWLGHWNRQCSFFDRGSPDVGSPANCDGHRSLTHQMAINLGPVGNRIHISDQDLILGGTLCFQGMYVVEGQAESARDNAVGSRLFTASWNGTRWDLVDSGGMLYGSILQRWTGATVDSNTNGGDDGRVYAAVSVSGPIDGFYHYEFALHNRDNNRGIGALHVPKCPGARVRNAGFRDVDTDATNDWSATVGTNEVTFATSAAPLRWNTIENFWFDCDAAPGSGSLTLDEFDAGAGLPSIAVTSSVPGELFNAYLGPGCAPGAAPSLFATGTPAQATLGNASFAVVSKGNQPLQPNYLFYGELPGTLSFHGCTIYMSSLASIVPAGVVLSDASGAATHSGSIPSDVSLEGRSFYLQAVGRDPGQGPLYSGFDLSDGLQVRVGNTVTGCP